MNEAERALTRLRGEICWGLSYDSQLNLSMSFGDPQLRVREPRPEAKVITLRRRGVKAVGTWWLWVYIARWKLSLEDGTRVTGRASRKQIDQALSRLAGERLDGAVVDSITGASTLRFDLGGVLEIRRWNRDDADDLWLLYEPGGRAMAVSADGRVSYGSSTDHPPYGPLQEVEPGYADLHLLSGA